MKGFSHGEDNFEIMEDRDMWNIEKYKTGDYPGYFSITTGRYDTLEDAKEQLEATCCSYEYEENDGTDEVIRF